MLNLNIDQINNFILNSLNFCNNYKRDIYPLFITNKYLLANSFHSQKLKFSKLPSSNQVACTTSEEILTLSRASFYAYEVTNNQDWKNLGLNCLTAYTNYFFTTPVPASPVIWDSHWLCVSYGNLVTKGKQPSTTPSTDPFNYGTFETIVNFNNGFGVLTESLLLADIYKVYKTSSKLKYKNIFSNLENNSSEYSIDYWVSNVYLEGVGYRVKQDGGKTITNEQIGLIKLTSSFTGQAKVVWSDYTGASVSSPTNTINNGDGLIEINPMLHWCKKNDTRLFLNTTFNTYWLGWDVYNLAFKHTNNYYWSHAADCFKFTASYALNLKNETYYYKKENILDPLKYPGSYYSAINNLNNSPQEVIVSRETLSQKIDYIKLQVNQAVANSNPYLEFGNNLIQTGLVSSVMYPERGTIVSIEAACNVEVILEIKLSLSQDIDDKTQEYTAYWFFDGSSSNKKIAFNFYDFVKWGSVVWHPKISENSFIKYSSGNGYVGCLFTQTTIGYIKPVVLVIDFNKNTGVAEVKLNDCVFTSLPPTIRYSSSGQILVRLKDSNGNFWRTRLPDSNNQWRKYTPSWDVFYGNDVTIPATPSNGTILECVFEAGSGVANMRLHYLSPDAGYDPLQIPISSIAYKVTIVSKIKTAYTLWVGDFKCTNNPLEKIPYTPGTVPFSRNVVKKLNSNNQYETIKDSWSDGVFNVGYISPYHQHVWGNIEARDNQIKFLSDSFNAYNNQSAFRIRGIPFLTFITALWDTDTLLRFGEKLSKYTSQILGFLFPFIFDKKTSTSSFVNKLNIFSTNPNDTSFYNCARGMEATARYIYENPNDTKAKSLVSQYLTFLKSDYEVRNSFRPLTDIPNFNAPESNSENPCNAASIGKAALYANLAGVDARLTTDIIDINYQYIISQYVSSGTMQGSFSLGQPTFTHENVTYREYYALWHAETTEFLSLLIKYKDTINYPQLSYLGVLPSIEPTAIAQIKAAPYNKEELIFSDGNRQSIRYRRTQAGRSLTIDYQAITHNDLEIIVNFWKQHGTSELFVLPPEVAIFSRYRVTGTELNYWRMSQPPSLDTVVATSIRGVYNTSITIIQD